MNDKDFVLSERPISCGSDPARVLRPHVLVADDDPGSCRFLADGLRSLGATVDTAASGEAALASAGSERFDLLLLDCRMPGGGALSILAQLRGDTAAASADALAVATSAELLSADRRELLAAGFCDVLLKPCTLADLRRVLAQIQSDATSCVLDDGAALYSSGDATTMRALRLLLREELALLQRELDQLSDDSGAFAERLHRLRSSCGFCGATALAEQAVRLQRQLSPHGPAPAAALASFRSVLRETLQALDG
ncbi:Response regulator OS=Rhodanobacter lindaniclasticus OX=75310 GN=B1991_12570 PE=4 SV=1 [Rhodanobacter lindaniclasticus]